MICCSASRLEDGDADHYIQGAGDDTENWACGLTAEAFWRNKGYLCKDGGEENVQSRVTDVMSQERRLKVSKMTPVSPSTTCKPFFIGTLEAVERDAIGAFDCIITCDNIEPPEASQKSRDHTGPFFLHLACRTGKLGSRVLRDQLGRIDPFLKSIFARTVVPTMLFACSTGRDLSIGVALAVLCMYYNDEGT